MTQTQTVGRLCTRARRGDLSAIARLHVRLKPYTFAEFVETIWAGGTPPPERFDEIRDLWVDALSPAKE